MVFLKLFINNILPIHYGVSRCSVTKEFNHVKKFASQPGTIYLLESMNNNLKMPNDQWRRDGVLFEAAAS